VRTSVDGKLGYLFPGLITVLITLSVVFFGQIALSQASPGGSTGFPALDQWKSAVIAGDAAALKAFYSADPAAEIDANGAKSGVDADVNFWLGLKARSLKLEIVRLKQRPGAESVIFKAEVQTANGSSVNVTDAQGWQKQGNQWRIIGVERTDAPHLNQPSDMKKDIYPSNADAHAEIKEAEEKAATSHKRVLLVFGANWCYDCHVLEQAFHGGQIDFEGKRFKIHARVPNAPSIPVYLSALRPASYELAGEVAEGAISWVSPSAFLRNVARPALRAGAAKRRDGASPRLVGHAFGLVSDDEMAVRELGRERLAGYTRLPFYQAMFAAAGHPDARDGAVSDDLADDPVLAGDEETVSQGIRRHGDIGLDGQAQR